MSIFKCEKCGCAENTALGWYWCATICAEDADWSDVGEEYKGKRLCSECAPSKYKNGESTHLGKWHEKFKKEPYNGQQ